MRRVGECRMWAGRAGEACRERAVWCRSGVVEKSVGVLRRALGGWVE